MSQGDVKVPLPFRWLGITVAVVSALMVVFGLFIPRWFNWLMPPGEENAEIIAKQAIGELAGDDFEMSAETVNEKVNDTTEQPEEI
jgi:hypothetical protein